MAHKFEFKMKKILNLIVFVLFCAVSFAQESTTVFHAMTLPASTKMAALGGENISAKDDQPSVVMHNPALLANLDTCIVGVQFMTYADGATWLGADFARAFGERHTGAVFAHYLGYGSMTETDEFGNTLGTFSPKDIILGAGYSYLLSNSWSGGANLKLDYSHIAGYSSLAIAVDLGLNYMNEEHDLSASLVMRNIGAQIVTFDGVTERLPFNLQLGISKGFDHLPVKVHVTLDDLTHWSSKNVYATDPEKGISTSQLLLNHLVIGAEVRPVDFMYIALGYNFRRGYELNAAGSSKLAGLTAGLGMSLWKMKFGLTFARYHQSTNAFMGNIAYCF